MSGSPEDAYDELARILFTYRRGLSTREQALESLRRLDPVFRAYRSVEEWLDVDRLA